MFGKGYVPDPVSEKDWVYGKDWKPQLPKSLPDSADLTPWIGQVRNQQQTSACVAFAVTKAMEIVEARQGRPTLLSPLQVYYLCRSLMVPDQVEVDKGTHIRLAVDVARRHGVATESKWPFSETRVFHRPDWDVMQEAFDHKVKDFYRIQSEGEARAQEVRECLLAGFPVVYGTVVDASWDRYRGSALGTNSKPSVLGVSRAGFGRHATVLVGFKGDVFVGLNSWGESWGYRGLYYADSEVITDPRARDFWVLRTSEA